MTSPALKSEYVMFAGKFLKSIGNNGAENVFSKKN